MTRTPLMHTLGRFAAAIGILAALLVLLSGSRSAAAAEREAPAVTAAFANGPGTITIEWRHQGPGVYGYAIQLQEGEQWRDVAQLDHTFGRYSLSDLTPSTWYTLRVCAVYGPAEGDRECSTSSVRVQTQAPAAPPADGVNPALVPPTEIRLSAGADFVRVDWGQTGRYNYLLVRLDDDQGNHDQRRVGNHSDGYLEFEGMRPGARYRIILKGCNEVTLGHDDCGPWSEDQFVTTELVKTGRSSFESVNVGGHFLRHRFSLGELSTIHSPLDRADATFIVVAGGPPRLSALPGVVGLESVNYPGHYLRHQDYRLKLHEDDGSELFRQDASFYVRKALNGVPGAVSFESVNFPGHYLRHQNYEFWLARDDGTPLFRDDASFRQQGPR